MIAHEEIASTLGDLIENPFRWGRDENDRVPPQKPPSSGSSPSVGGQVIPLFRTEADDSALNDVKPANPPPRFETELDIWFRKTGLESTTDQVAYRLSRAFGSAVIRGRL